MRSKDGLKKINVVGNKIVMACWFENICIYRETSRGEKREDNNNACFVIRYFIIICLIQGRQKRQYVKGKNIFPPSH